jgi:2-oxoisovalerate dehydrogenase E1 component
MALQTRVKLAKLDAPKLHGLDGDTLIRIYRTMYLSRRLDDREIQLKRQNKIFFQISGAGHEAVTAAMGLVLRPGVDWIYSYYRDRALCLMLGVKPIEMLLQAVGAKDDPSSGGRQMPSHWGHSGLNIVNKSSCTGTQFVQSVGAAEATLYYEGRPKALAQAKKAPLGQFVGHESDEIVFVSGGDGATSEGEFWESLNAACAKKLPFEYLIETTATPYRFPSKCRRRRQHLEAYARVPGPARSECDGTDLSRATGLQNRRAILPRASRPGAHPRSCTPLPHLFRRRETLQDAQSAKLRRTVIRSEVLFVPCSRRHPRPKEIESLEAESIRSPRADEALAAEEPQID